MDLQVVVTLAVAVACVALTGWTTYRVSRALPVHWIWKTLSVPAAWVAAMAVIVLLGIALGWSGEKVLNRMVKSGFTYMLLHACAMIWGPRWFETEKPSKSKSRSGTRRVEMAGAVTRVQITLFGEEVDGAALEARARIIRSRALEALPGVQVDLAISGDMLTSEAGFPTIRSDAMRQEDHQAVEAALLPILRSVL